MSRSIAFGLTSKMGLLAISPQTKSLLPKSLHFGGILLMAIFLISPQIKNKREAFKIKNGQIWEKLRVHIRVGGGGLKRFGLFPKFDIFFYFEGFP